MDSSGIDFDFSGCRFTACIYYLSAVVAVIVFSALFSQRLLVLAVIVEAED
jgi:hypothetical protein